VVPTRISLWLRDLRTKGPWYVAITVIVLLVRPVIEDRWAQPVNKWLDEHSGEVVAKVVNQVVHAVDWGTVAWWAPIPLAIVILILHSYGDAWRMEGRSLPPIILSGGGTMSPAPARPTPAASVRDFLPAGVTPAFLSGLRKDRTGVAGDRLVAPYLGKWISVSSTVRDVSENMGLVRVELGDLMSPPIYIADFDPAKRARLELIPLGTQAKVIGRITTIGAVTLFLEDCELVEGEG
jgi:hypothetical protein